MFPLYDENPTTRPPVATIAIIIACASAWVFVQGLGGQQPLAHSLCAFGLIPGKLLGMLPAGTRVPIGVDMYCVLQDQRGLYTLFTHMFMHGGWFHLIGNMWFLWVFGDNVEDAMGPGRFILFYLLCGLAAATAQTLTNTSSALPMVGASGAIGGVMGAYGRLYPHARVQTLLILGFLITRVSMPAIAMLGYWFVIQLVAGIPSLSSAGGGVAFWAHIGGFLCGFLLVPLFRRQKQYRG
jgi:membrane associated rhomboid family serine protease